MPPKPRIAYFAHSLRSDWNNGNAHFLRGLLRSLGELGHNVTAFEALENWSIHNLQQEARGADSLAEFNRTYHDLNIETYTALNPVEWERRLASTDIVILHEWNPPEIAHLLLALRDRLGFRLLFHDTHHRASSSPQQMALFQLHRFDGILAFGKVLEDIYRDTFHIDRVWTLHEAADTSVFHPLPGVALANDVTWIGNWGDEERSAEIARFLLEPAGQLSDRRFTVFGVRYPEAGVAALAAAGVHFGGYLPNLEAPCAYAASRLTLHIPRRSYAQSMPGIPTIRVFEALACGIPLISAPWQDAEDLFREGDFLFVEDRNAMREAIAHLLSDPGAAAAQAARGLETVLARHTCRHRAEQLSNIIQENLS